jgi:5-methylcytosine-specific restriction protein B
MTIENVDAQWDSFLARWPLEKLGEITLQEYSQAGDSDSFTYWLEATTEKLGSIWGGSAFKFGVYSRKDKSDKQDGSGKSYTTEYGWYRKYGTTPEEAFKKVRSIILEIAKAARAGNLVAIENAELGSAVKWKIAFLYQDRANPTVLPVYSSVHLSTYLGQTTKASMSQLQQAALANRGGVDVLTFGRNVWREAEEKLSALVLKPEDVLTFFQDNPERFQPIKPYTIYIGGFTTAEGLCIAVSRKQKEAKLWLEPGAWLEKIKGQLKDIEYYPAERSRNSNLDSNAPTLATGNPAVFLTVPTHAALVALCDAYDNTENMESSFMPTDSPLVASVLAPLNQILFGPPGTGKTYATIDETLRILDPDYLQQHQDDRAALKGKFDEFAAKEKVRFVTFHQSFSYEDFVEGLRAVTNDDKQLEYLVEPGVFKRLCDDARTQGIQPNVGIRSNPRIWKISINGTGPSPTKTYCLNHGEARIGWGETGDLSAEPFIPNDYYQSIGTGNQGTLRYFAEEIVRGDILLCIHSSETIAAIGVVTGDYRYEQIVPQDVISGYKHVLPVNWLYRDLELPILPLNDGKQFTLKTVYLMERFTWGDLLSHIEKSGAKAAEQVVAVDKRQPHVLIIDEINRGNISRIFGELITLIELSKRAGADEALSVTLPYSKKPFSVPPNVYLIGTMNTADRSLAGLDIALRRRFTFKEMPPQPERLDGIYIQGANVGQMLRKMNERIEVLLDRDHCLGHAYFMSLKNNAPLSELKIIFRQQILPLLQEYFFEDWERIAWVLNDQRKTPEQSFVQKISADHESLFGSSVAGNLQNADRRWRINEQAFDNIDSYRAILGVAF